MAGRQGIWCSPFLDGVTEVLGEQGFGSKFSDRLDESGSAKDRVGRQTHSQVAAILTQSTVSRSG